MNVEQAQEIVNRNIDLLFGGKCQLVVENENGDKMDVAVLLKYIMLEAKLVTPLDHKSKRVREE